MNPHEKHIQEVAVVEHESFGEVKNRRWDTPKELIESAVREAVGSNLRGGRRIVNGESNEVHDVVTESGDELIVRISHDSKPKFAKEKWALEKCDNAGVPVPEVFLVKSVDEGDTHGEICVESKLAGQNLDKIPDILSPEKSEELKDLLRQLGKALRKIHGIPTQGFGKLDDEGVGMFRTVEEMIAGDKYIGRDSILPALKDDPEKTATLLRAYEMLKRDAGTYTSPLHSRRIL